MGRTTNQIKTQISHRKDGRLSLTIKLIGYTEEELEDLGLALTNRAAAGELIGDLGAHIRRCITEPKP